ncbi:MAG: cbb3-type cytochrome c oxidase subunit 3 [Sphingobacteriales bacterium]|nr:MAG: cbb3-type cytochrome c oxidase subunit 3 [Sphingobacteriales bacterium]
MYKQILQSLDSVAPLAIGALIAFILFFILLTIWTSKRNKGYIQHMSELPLEDSSTVSYESPNQVKSF